MVVVERPIDDGDVRVPSNPPEKQSPARPPRVDLEADFLPIEERGMSQPSGVFPALYDNVKKRPKPTKKKTR
jgi:hypothetical protein